MEDKIFCSKCGWRIWRHADNRPLVDVYFQDRHFKCDFALSVRGVITGNGPDPTYAERREKEEHGGAK